MEGSHPLTSSEVIREREEGSHLSHSLVHHWLHSQTDQFLNRDPEETDSSPSGDEWDTDCEDMLDSEAKDTPSEKYLWETNSESGSYEAVSEDGATDVRCHSEDNSTVKQQERDESANDATVPCISDSDIDYNKSNTYHFCVEDASCYEITHRQNASYGEIVSSQEPINEIIVHAEDVRSEQIVYVHEDYINEQEGTVNEHFLYAQEGAPSEQSVQEAALNEQLVYVQANEQNVYVQEDTLNEQFVYMQEDALNEQFVYVQEGALNEHFVYVQEGALNEQFVYVQEGALNEQFVYVQEDALNEQFVYMQEDVRNEQEDYPNDYNLLAQELLQNEEDFDDDPFQLNQDAEFDDFSDEEPVSGDSGCLDREEQGDHDYGDYSDGLQQYDPGSDTDSGIHKMY